MQPQRKSTPSGQVWGIIGALKVYWKVYCLITYLNWYIHSLTHWLIYWIFKGAQKVCSDYNGVIPSDLKGLLSIPGIGPYTAGAISSIAYKQPNGLVDGNVIRVMSRLRAMKLEQGIVSTHSLTHAGYQYNAFCRPDEIFFLWITASNICNGIIHLCNVRLHW